MKREKVSFQRGDMENLSMFNDCSYDLVNSSHTIHYIKNLQRCFNEIFRVLKPGESSSLVFRIRLTISLIQKIISL